MSKIYGTWYDITPRGEEYNRKLINEWWGDKPRPKELSQSQSLELATKPLSERRHNESLILSDIELAGFPRVYPTHVDDLASGQSKAGVALQGRRDAGKLRSSYKSLVKRGYIEELKSKPTESVLNQYSHNFVQEEVGKGTLKLTS